MKDLIVIEQLPQVPESWDYETSVAKVKQLIYKWKNITVELATELWVAREILSNPGKRTDLVANATKLPTWSQYCQEVGCDRSTLHRWLNRFFLAQQAQLAEPPKGQSQVIYADPPWDYSNTGFDQSAKQHYPTIPTIELCNPKTWLKLPIHEILEDRSVLFLWVTYPFAKEGFQVCDAWGFDYKAQMVWVKSGGTGTGWWVEPRHELLYIAAKGQELHPAIKPESVFYYERHNHSQKPKEVYEMIEAMYTGPYIELFARNTREGWQSWGNEV
jgi:N6-adenosine-specific RNA methylase IME4